MKSINFSLFLGDSYVEFLGEPLWDIFTFKDFTNVACNAAKRAGGDRIVSYCDLEIN